MCAPANAPFMPEHTIVLLLLERGSARKSESAPLDAQRGENVLHQVLVDPSVSLQPLAVDPDDLRPLQETHLQLEGHGYLPKVPFGPTLQGVPRGREQGK